MRTLILGLVAGGLLAALVFAERRKPVVPVGLGAVMRLVADFERQAERLPLTVTQLSDDEERKVGVDLASQYGIADLSASASEEDRAILGYLDEIGRRLAGHVDRGGIPYHFYLVSEPGFVNAYALPGGHIVVGRALLDLMVWEDELAAVLGHEIAHVDRRHCIERLQYEIAAQKLGVSIPYALASIPVSLFQAGYSKELELEADRIGIGFAVDEGYSPEGGISLFKRLQEKYGEPPQGEPSTPADELAQAVYSGLGEYLRSHPPAAERIAGIEQEIVARQWKRTRMRKLQLKMKAKAEPRP